MLPSALCLLDGRANEDYLQLSAVRTSHGSGFGRYDADAALQSAQVSIGNVDR